MTLTYTSEYYQALREGARRSARATVPIVMRLLAPKSVIDVGCGGGTWLSVFREHGVSDLCGVDGDYVERDCLEIPIGSFLPRDLARPFHLERRFDLAMSLEVAEHLPPDSADTFVESLTRLAQIVIFSAAAPYLGGAEHINEQWPEYWAEKFAAYDYLPVDCFRRALWGRDDVEWWYAQNLFLYVARRALHENAALLREHEACPRPLPLVHPRRYLEWIEWGLSQMQQASPSAAQPGQGGAG